VLSHELAHIVFGHNLGSKYAFNDRMLFSDEGTYQNLGFKHIPEEETAADKKAVDLLKNSPYAQKLDNVGLFLKALQQKRSAVAGAIDDAPGQSAGRERTGNTPLRSVDGKARRWTTTSSIRSRRCPWADA
jgi:ABC-type ATPase involved in cell division